MSRSGAGLQIDDVGYALVDRNQVNVDPVAAHSSALNEALRTMPVAQCLICGALPGQTVVIRYPRLRNMALNQIDEAIEAEAGQNIPYDLAEVFLDWSLLEEEGEDDDKQLKVLLVAAKHEVIDSRVQIADEAGIQYGVLSVDSLALADAAEGCDFLQVGETVALINIGASSVSIHFTRDGISNFIRDVSWGARELIQAIAKSRRCDYDEAERMLYNAEEELAKAPAEPEPVAPEPAAPDPFADSGGGSDELGSLLDPLDGELDALGGDALGGDPEPAEPASNEFGMGDISMNVGGAEASMAEILAMPITRLVSEVRRSFDYYEHQLYERPVDRIILSGGVAHLPVLRDAFMDDLGVENVEVANPTSGSLGVSGNVAVEFEQHPAQFMVAVGLAARGAADL
jgi:type IV pilus assembly protein PilM